MRLMNRERLYMIRLCSDRAAYEAVPRKRAKLDIMNLKRSLQAHGGCEIALCTPQFIVIKRRDDVEVTIVDDGRMIIRNVRNQEEAQRIAETILPDGAVRDR